MCAIVARDQEAEDTSRSKVRSIQGFVAACLVLSVVFASLRFYVRLRILRSFRKDDWAVVATLILLICSGVMATVASHHGLGSHMSILTDSEKTFFLVLIWISSLGYLATTIAIKTAFLLQYRRAFPLPTFQRLCDIFLGFLAVWLLAGFITQFAICHPLSRQWDPMVIENGQSCKVRFHFWLANAIMHIATDIVLFIMPFPMIRNLSQNRMQKFVLGGVFSLGFLSVQPLPCPINHGLEADCFSTCAISAIRLTTLHAALMGTDQSWEMATTLFWSVGEATCAVVCLCVPTLRPLLGPRKQWRSGQIWTGEPEQGPSPERITRPESDAWNYHVALREAGTTPSTSADGL